MAGRKGLGRRVWLWGVEKYRLAACLGSETLEQGGGTFLRLSKERPDFEPCPAAPDHSIAANGPILDERPDLVPARVKPAAQEALPGRRKECTIKGQDSIE